MKNYITLFILFSIGIVKVSAQTDTLIISEENSLVEDDKYNRVYKLFIEDRDREIKRLWKVDLIGFALLSPNLKLEQGLGKSWSSETGLEFGIPSFMTGSYNIKAIINRRINLGAGISQSFKYYYNLNRRNKLGKRTNGFSGNYFAVYMATGYRFYNSENLNFKSWGTTGGIHYGLQRRIGNIGYIEGFVGLNFNYRVDDNIYSEDVDIEPHEYREYRSEWIPFVGIKAGFAIDSFKNLKRMLKK